MEALSERANSLLSQVREAKHWLIDNCPEDEYINDVNNYFEQNINQITKE